MDHGLSCRTFLRDSVFCPSQ